MSHNWRRLITLCVLVSAGLTAGTAVFAGGTQEVPEAEIATSGVQYISPNGDGVQDTGTIDFEVTVYVKSREGYVPEYGIEVTGPDGEVVRRIVQQEESDVGWFMRLFRAFQAFTLEKSISWDGTDADGDQVQDGIYDVTMWVISGSQRRIDLDLDGFVVDTQPPSVRVSAAEPKIFSPNEDGYLEEYEIEQTDGTVEDQWEATIEGSGGSVARSYVWTDAAPDDIVWDGTDEDGELAADGTYEYRISSTDRAGNSFAETVSGIELQTTETPITVSVGTQYISPNADGAQDTTEIELYQAVSDGIESWRLQVVNRNGDTVREYGAESPVPPESILFDGKDDAGEVLRHGPYNVVYSLRYRHGNRPAVSEPLIVDLMDPEIDVQVSEDYISPNGDGRQDDTRISFRASEPVTWRGSIRAENGEVVLQTGSDVTTSLIVWDGTSSSGEFAGEGRYTMEATFTDVAGNTFSPPRETVVVDVTDPVVEVDLNRTYFSPDDDGIKDTVTARLETSEPVRGVLELSDRAGRDFGTYGGFGRAAQVFDGTFSYEWSGISGSGLIVPDGTYVVSSTFHDFAGNRVEMDPLQLVIDTRPVSVVIDAPTGFSPNGDGTKDILTLDVIANFYDTVDSWKVEFVDGSGRTMQIKEGTETLPKTILWDGGMQYGDEVAAPEGLYTANLEVLYRKGNEVDTNSNRFFIDVTPPAVNLQAAADPFARTNGDMEGDLFITLRIDDAHSVDNWSLDIVTPDNEVVRSFTGRGDLQDQLVWKDRDQSLEGVPTSERVELRVSVVDEVGNSGGFSEQVPLDLILVKRDGKLYLMVDNIIFGAYQYELDSRGPEWYANNLESLSRVMQIYEKYPRHRLLLEGHALNIYRGDEEAEAEEEEILVPLTENRAKTVRDALVDRGMAPDKIDIEWFGGKYPIVDVHDRSVRWKNRRVEFIMVKEREE